MNNKEKPTFFRRTVAYVIDLFIVLLLASIIYSMIYGNDTRSVKYIEDLGTITEKMNSTKEKYDKKEITQEEYDQAYEEYTKERDDLYYINSKDTVGQSIIIVGVSLIYYVVLCFFCKGITLGKYIMKLQIVSAKEKELNIGNYLLRALFVNMVLSQLFTIASVYLMNKELFLTVHPKVSQLLSLFLLVTILVIMYREDGRGLHDLIAGTKIISTKEKKEQAKEENKDNVEKVKEATVIDEKNIKKTTKRKTKKEVNKK